MIFSGIKRATDPLKRPGDLVHFGAFLTILILVGAVAFALAAPVIGGSYGGVCDAPWW